MHTRSKLVVLAVLVAALCMPPRLATTAESAAPAQIDELGSIGGGTYAIAVSGNTVLIGEGTNLVAIDASTPQQPNLSARLRLPGHPQAILIAGSMAFVKTSVYADGYQPALQLVDIHDLSRPELRASYTTATMPAVSGNMIYLAAFDGLHIIDASDPSQPVERGVYSAPFYPSRVALTGSLVVLTEASKLHVFDVRDPARPTLVGQIGPLDTAANLQIQGTLAYLAGNMQLQIIDLADPTAPVIRGQIALPVSARALRVDGAIAYITAARSNSIFEVPQTLLLVDVGAPSAPALRGSYQTTGEIASIQVASGMALVAAKDAGLQVLDVSQPDTPSLRASYAPGAVYDVRIVDGLAYLAVDGRGLDIVDFANPSQPVQYGMLRLIGPVQSVQVAGGLAVLLDSQSLWIVDARQPAHPAVVARVDRQASLPDILTPWIGIKENLAYVGYLGVRQANQEIYREFDLLILDLHAVPQPAVIGATSTRLLCSNCPTFARFALANDTIIAAYGTDELVVFDVSNPTSPMPAGMVFVSDGAVDVQAVDQRVIVQGATNRMSILEIDMPGHARWLGAYTASGPISALRAAGNIIYLSSAANFEIVDVQNPAAPVQIGSCQTGEPGTQIDVTFGRVYLRRMAYAIGLGYRFAFKVIDISDLAHPSTVLEIFSSGNVATQFTGTALVVVGGQRYPTRPLNGSVQVYRLPFPDAGWIAGDELPAPPHGLTVEGTRIYVADGASGIRIYRFYLPTYLPLISNR